jgi:hypothetical protein
MADVEDTGTGKSLRSIFSEHMPNRLWHHTNTNGVLGIATTKSLYCFDYRGFADKLETLTFAVKLQQKLIELLRKQLSKEDVDFILSTCFTKPGTSLFLRSVQTGTVTIIGAFLQRKRDML